MGLGEEGTRRKRTSEISTTFTANTIVSAQDNSFNAAGLISVKEFPFLIKVMTIAKLDQMRPS